MNYYHALRRDKENSKKKKKKEKENSSICWILGSSVPPVFHFFVQECVKIF